MPTHLTRSWFNGSMSPDSIGLQLQPTVIAMASSDGLQPKSNDTI